MDALFALAGLYLLIFPIYTLIAYLRRSEEPQSMASLEERMQYIQQRLMQPEMAGPPLPQPQQQLSSEA